MTSATKPIILYSHATGPNPWKVAIVLEELGVPYDTHYKEFSELKGSDFDANINPNGRVPAIHDPNTGLNIWESGAIIEYLIELYDKSGALHYAKTPERFYTQQWLHFQVSGQGPYFGQAAWFSLFHPEKNLDSAIQRYYNEVKRVTKVLDSALKKNGGKSLVGDKVTYADLSFLTWYWIVPFFEKTGELEKSLHADNPTWSKWINELEARPSVKKVKATRQAKISG